jgi:3-deoxy-manno-octulosonate cytidylyltransferase (CMP-KDO synthetase)
MADPASDIAIVIPARYGSKRLPGKPMALIAGRSLLHRVWAIARSVTGASAVYVATDDDRVADHAAGFGAAVIMTSPACANGTERVREAMDRLPRPPAAVINLQGDAVLTPPWVVQGLVDAFRADTGLSLVTPAVHLGWDQLEALRKSKETTPGSGTLVTFDRAMNALYFSKTIIPYLRNRTLAEPPVYRHIGIYGYRADVLARLAALPATPLETAEQLEQLRALEHGIPIRIVLTDYRGRTHWSVDAPEDITAAEAIIAREGELLPDV